ncbi:MAG: cellulase family glycosylhydrolase [Acidobacteria bacterium]|nr:cellulase family glycosylhydrolase [Acidobacteriota bacterium]
MAAGDNQPYAQNTQPRWRGFNLQEKFTDTPREWLAVAPEWGRRNERFQELDFAWIAKWGFNYVRLPMSYRCWTRPENPYELNEATLKEIDQAVLWGKRYGIHVCLNFHRAPGYCINQAYLNEPWDLWTDDRALDIFARQWASFSARYKGISSKVLSFNLLNEPNKCTQDQYARVVRAAVLTIRAKDPDRLIAIDGMFGEACLPVLQLVGISNSIQCTRGYAPFSLTHYQAPWAGRPQVLPRWPMPINETQVWDNSQLQRWCIEPFSSVPELKSRTFVGEWGCWNQTPHKVTLAWMENMLTLWKAVDWGWALWCFRGSFGILDSARKDVRYEYWKGHRLDREMLELLRAF